MLIIHPSSVVYFCTRDPLDLDHGVQRATISLTPDSPRTGQYAQFSVRDSKCEHGESRIVSVQEHTAATVYVHDYDANHNCYVTWYEDGTVGIDCPPEVNVLRRKLMVECGFKPKWEWRG